MQATLRCADGRGLEFCAWFDAELFRQPALVGGECEIGGDQADLALADDLEQVELGHGLRIGQRAMALCIEFHRDGVVAAAGDRSLYRIDARP